MQARKRAVVRTTSVTEISGRPVDAAVGGGVDRRQSSLLSVGQLQSALRVTQLEPLNTVGSALSDDNTVGHEEPDARRYHGGRAQVLPKRRRFGRVLSFISRFSGLQQLNLLLDAASDAQAWSASQCRENLCFLGGPAPQSNVVLIFARTEIGAAGGGGCSRIGRSRWRPRGGDGASGPGDGLGCSTDL